MTYLIIKGTLVAVAVVGYGVYQKYKGRKNDGYGGAPPFNPKDKDDTPKEDE